MKKLLLGMLGAASFLAACGNEVVIEQGGGSSSSSGSSSSGTSSGMAVECVVQDQGPSAQPTCADLERLVVVDPIVGGDTDGDGLIEPGETATITVKMKDISGYGFNWYPGVVFSSSDDYVTVQADTWYYAILACGEQEATATLNVAPDANAGKSFTIRASVNMLNGDCTDTPTLAIPLQVQ